MKKILKYSMIVGLFAVLLSCLSGCEMGVMDPKGMIASREKEVILDALGLMLIVVIPVIIMTFLFAYKYRESRPNEKYTPEWAHNNWLEFIWWLVPCLIIIVLATITWKTSHELDPYKPIESDKKPVKVQVVSLDWKWLFIYPEQKIATVNYLEIPENTPIDFDITADSPMNGFWMPQLAGQIYAMQGMQTKLHIVANEVGTYVGRGATFTGPGFSDMFFNINVVPDNEFDAWVNQVKTSNNQSLTTENYIKLSRPSIKDPVQYFNDVADNLFDDIMMKFMMPMDNMVDHEMQGKNLYEQMNAHETPEDKKE